MALYSKTDVTKHAFSRSLPPSVWYDHFTVEVEGVEYLMTLDWLDAAAYWLHETDPELDARIYVHIVQ